MTDRLNKTSICSIVFLDIIDYSKKSVSEQIDDKTLFNDLINESIKNVAQNDRIILDTGDGAAITLQGAPEEALFVALTIRDGILEHNKINGECLQVRIGINLGSVRVVKDVNGRPNIIGDGINVAQRIMSFAGENQILVSRSYFEVTSRLTKEMTGMFTYSGIRQDKHVREHEVYLIKPKDEESIKVTESDLTETDLLASTSETVGFDPSDKAIKRSFLMLIIGAGLLLGIVILYLSGFQSKLNVPLKPSTLQMVIPVKLPVKVPDKEVEPVSEKLENQDNKIKAEIQERKLPVINDNKPTDNKVVKKKRAKKVSAQVQEEPLKPIEAMPIVSKPKAVKLIEPVKSVAPVKKRVPRVCSQAEVAMNQCR